MSDMELVRVSKRFGASTVIPDLSLDVADGEFVVLVGPSGCGKSTLLRMIAGLEDISAGDLVIGGARANDMPPQKRDIAMVFQSYALFPHMSVRRNITFGPRVRGETGEAIERRLERASRILNLSDYLDRTPAQLSGGQRQRVAMGRSIVRDPKLFLFDEPLSNLDAKLRIAMRTEIKSLHQTLGTTTIYVTHDQIEAMTMADRIVVMNAGCVEQVGDPLTLYDRPANIFVAGFIGSPAMSFLDATFASRGGEAAVVLPSGTRLPCAPVNAREGAPLRVGVRPEHFLLDTDGPLTLRVDVVEPTGPETHVYGMLEDQPTRCVFRERLSARPGERLRLTVPPAQIHVFDGQSGERIGPPEAAAA